MLKIKTKLLSPLRTNERTNERTHTQALPKASQDVIADINVKMGEGMAYFIGKDMGQGTENTKEYDLYCHYVAGLVGEGLSRLFVAAGYEQEVVAKDLYTSNSMGLFLQKTNIIRDYLEDYVDGRAWWPQDVWKKHCVEEPKDLGGALRCHLVVHLSLVWWLLRPFLSLPRISDLK